MLLSNDGDWLNSTIHPSKGLIKKYIVSVSKPINLQKFNKAVVDREENLRILDIRQLKRLTYEVSLKTGKNREIRRIFNKLKIKLFIGTASPNTTITAIPRPIAGWILLEMARKVHMPRKKLIAIFSMKTALIKILR